MNYQTFQMTSSVKGFAHSPRKLLAMMFATLLLCPFLPLTIKAAAGDLDPAFGSGGKVTTDFFLMSDEAFAVAIQSDGKIVAAGSTIKPGTGRDFALARYLPNGTLDNTFGMGGKVTTDFFGNFDQIEAIAIQSDGKIVAAGLAITGTFFDFALARYNTDGSLDITFDGDGKVTTNFFGFSDEIMGIAIQCDGKIVVAGRAFDGTIDNIALARYNSDGGLDTTFDGDGKVTTNFSGFSAEASSVALQTDGKIVVAGRAANSTGSNFALARYNSDGSLDTTFDGDGKVTTDFFASSSANDLAIQSDGRIIAAGFVSAAGGSDLALARYTSNGGLDTTFGSGGRVTISFFTGTEDISAITLQSDGKILAAGFGLNTGGTADFVLSRYNPNGSLDTTFGSGGKAVTDFFGQDDLAFDLALQSDGKIVVVGLAESSTVDDFALARYLGGAAFDICLQDDTNGNSLKFNSQTGDFLFRQASNGFTLMGRGTITTSGCKITLNNSALGISATVDTCLFNGTATLTRVIQPRRITVQSINDTDTRDNNCDCA